MNWVHRVIEHRLSPERRKGLEHRVNDDRRRRDDSTSAAQPERRKGAERRTPRNRRTAQRRGKS